MENEVNPNTAENSDLNPKKFDFKKWLPVGFVFLVILILGGLVLLSGGNKDEKENIKIGVIAPLTGPLAEYGVAFKNGIELANKDYPNKNIRYIFEDNKWDSKEAISAFNKLVQIDNVDVVMNWGTPTSEAIAPIVGEQVPLIAITTEPPIIKQSSYIIRGGFNQPGDYIAKVWEYLRSQNIKRLAIIKTEIVYLDSLFEQLEKQAKTNESVVLVDNFIFEDSDFRSTIQKLRQGNYDAIGVLLVSGQISTFYRQAKELGLDLPLTFGSDFFESQSEIDAASGLMEGAVYANTGVAEGFRERYFNTYNNSSQLTSAGYGYDLAKILNTRTDYQDKNTVMESLKSIKEFEGIEGVLEYKETENDRYFDKSTFLKIIKDGKINILN